jgi:rsbT co-antagonist protein RsbR
VNDSNTELTEQAARVRAALDTQRAIRALIFDECPEGVCVLDREGGVEINAAASRILNTAPTTPLENDWQETWGFWHLDGTACPFDALPGFKALEGVAVPPMTLRARGPEIPEGVVLSIEAQPTPEGRSISTLRDITERVRLKDELEDRARRLIEGETENRELIQRLRVAIDQIANPVLRVARDVLVMPLIGVIDATRSERAAERLLEEVATARARWVVIDVTGIELIDTMTADHFDKLTRAVQLLGAQASISGMRPSVARTMIELGISLQDLPSYRNLRQALEATLTERSRGRRAAPHRAEEKP